MTNDRVAVLVATAAFVVVIAAVALSSGPSTADFVVDSVSPGSQLVTLDPRPPASFAAPDPRPAGAILLTWTASATATVRAETTYSVQRSPAGANTWTEVTDGLTSLSYTDTPPSDGSYDYKIRTDVASFFAESAERAGLSDRTAPTAASGVASSVNLSTTLGAVDLAWTAGSDATSGLAGYTIRYVAVGALDLTCPAASEATYTSTTGVGAVTSASVTGLTSATKYCFYLVTEDGAGNQSGASNTAGPTAAK